MRRRDFFGAMAQLGAAVILPTGSATRLWRTDHHLPAPRLDAHAHVFSPALVARTRALIRDPDISAAVRPIDAKYLVDELDRTGVERALVLSTAYVNATDVQAFGAAGPSAAEHRRVRDDNDFTAAECATAPDRLVPFASVNPKREYALDEVTRCVERLGMRGVKIHFGNSDIRLRNTGHLAQVRSILTYAAERRIPVVAHIHNDQLEGFGGAEIHLLVSALLEPLTMLRVSVAHLGWGGGAGSQTQAAFAALTEALKRRPQVAARTWVDCSGVLLSERFAPVPSTSEAEQGQLAQLIRVWGLEHLLWGSDTIPGALDQSRAVWPLTDSDWQTMAGNDGLGLLDAALGAEIPEPLFRNDLSPSRTLVVARS